MSTKTSIKRIALVAVSALGFGLLSIVPSNADVDNASLNARGVIATLTAGSVSSTAETARSGQPFTIGVNATTIAGANGKDLSLNAVFTQVPSGETAYNTVSTTATSNWGPTVTAKTAAQLETATFIDEEEDITAVVDTNSATTVPSFVTYELDAADNIIAEATATEIMTMTFTPSAVGTYKIFVWADDASGAAIQSFDAGEKSVVVTIVVGGAPTVLTISQPTSSAATLNGDYATEGGLLVATLTDAAGNPTTLTGTEAITVSTTAGTLSDSSLTTADFNSSGKAITKLYHNAAGTQTVTFTPTGSIAGAFATKTAAVTFTASSTAFNLDAGASVRDTTGFVADTGDDLSDIDTNDIAYITPGKTSLTIRLPYVTGTAAVTVAKITDTTGAITGYEGASWLVPVSIAAADDYGTLVVSGLGALSAALGDEVDVEWQEADAVVLTIAPQARALTTVSLTPGTVTAATGGTITLTANTLDQFGSDIVGAVVAFSVSGRNSTSGATTQVITNADGEATYNLVDTSTSLTSLTSTVAASGTFNGTTVAATSASITFGTYTVTSVSLATAIDTNPLATTTITTAAGGAMGSYETVTATLATASGSPIGLPVTFAVSGLTGAGVVTGYTTVYTNGNGVASARIYSYATGTATVTATAGALSDSGTVAFVNSATDARTITASASGNLVTATVKDRYGNPVKLANVVFSRVGTGYFGTGGSSVTVATDANGVAEAVVVGNGGTTTVTATLDVLTYTQVDDAAGKVGTTIVTATGAGASLAPAGIASATVSVSPVDSAAVEAAAATAAAKAAGDAAVAAAKAAEAAAKAAQDAAVAAAEKAALDAVAAAKAAGDAAVAAAVKAALDAVAASKAAQDAAVAEAQAATDAAAEAIDASNAATDAANLAAEAADAATVAAEEARDAADAATAAVEELATQVASLMAALKAQITTLANTVAKIAKKVKA